MSNSIFKPMAAIFLYVLLSAGASAQSTGWSTQGPSGCRDQYGAFDAYIPGMRGSGSCNRGGFVPGTNIVIVTNTDATGSGSLDAASNVACPKVILFGVSGLINRAGQINFNCDGWSLVGASAPGQVTITGGTGSPLIATQNSSNWTIDHLTIAAGDADIQPGAIGNRDSTGMVPSSGETTANGIVMNSNLVWGGDETAQCYGKGTVTNLLFWQNIIGRPVGGSGLHILQNTCKNVASIRNFYIHGNGRHPLVRGDGYFHANNFTANPGYANVAVQPCEGGFAPLDSNIRMHFINNLMARGQNSGNMAHIAASSVTNCVAFSMYETGSYTMNDSFQIESCGGHGCVSGVPEREFASSPITAVYPAGYVAESVANTQQGYIDFATQVTAFAGATPTSRLAFFDTLVSQGINHVDGSGDRSGWGAPVYPVGQPLDGTTAQGGISVITPASNRYDPTDGNDNPCGEDMPIGVAADAIQSSGLTRLHEWVIGCFYDNVMPAGYREDKLQNYPAPGGGGIGLPPPPAPRPNPPFGLDVVS